MKLFCCENMRGGVICGAINADMVSGNTPLFSWKEGYIRWHWMGDEKLWVDVHLKYCPFCGILLSSFYSEKVV